LKENMCIAGAGVHWVVYGFV